MSDTVLESGNGGGLVRVDYRRGCVLLLFCVIETQSCLHVGLGQTDAGDGLGVVFLWFTQASLDNC